MTSRKMLANNLIPELYAKLYVGIKEELKEVKYVALTTDMWTSVAGQDYMALTCHFLISDKTTINTNHKCLEVVPFTEVGVTPISG